MTDDVDMVIIKEAPRHDAKYKVTLGRVSGQSEAFYTDKLEMDL